MCRASVITYSTAGAISSTSLDTQPSDFTSIKPRAMRMSEKKPYILAFHIELVAMQLTLMDTVSVLTGREWVGFFLDSKAILPGQRQFPVQITASNLHSPLPGPLS
jgi:hypothetical protein